MAKKTKPMEITDNDLVGRVIQEREYADTQSESFLADQRINSNYAFTNNDTQYTIPATGMSGTKFFFTNQVTNTLVMYLSKQFCSDKRTVEFNPTNVTAESAEAAKQLERMVNDVLHRKNDGFDIISSMLRSAAVHKMGIAKTVWERNL